MKDVLLSLASDFLSAIVFLSRGRHLRPGSGALGLRGKMSYTADRIATIPGLFPALAINHARRLKWPWTETGLSP